MVHAWSEQQHCNLLVSLSNFYCIAPHISAVFDSTKMSMITFQLFLTAQRCRWYSINVKQYDLYYSLTHLIKWNPLGWSDRYAGLMQEDLVDRSTFLADWFVLKNCMVLFLKTTEISVWSSICKYQSSTGWNNTPSITLYSIFDHMILLWIT